MTNQSQKGVATMHTIRQGDVLLLPVADLPQELVEVPRDAGRLVLAYGEATGHAHVVDAPPDEAQLLRTADDARFLRIMSAAFLVHEEHAAIELAPGTYRQVPQEEWADSMEPRRVID